MAKIFAKVEYVKYSGRFRGVTFEQQSPNGPLSVFDVLEERSCKTLVNALVSGDSSYVDGIVLYDESGEMRLVEMEWKALRRALDRQAIASIEKCYNVKI